MLTLWASIVAEKLGHQPSTALTLGRAIAGNTARLKSRAVGRDKWVAKHQAPLLNLDISKLARTQGYEPAFLLGKTIPLLLDNNGEPRAALRTLPTRDGVVADEYVAADPAEVGRYLVRAFGNYLVDVRTAMEVLAARYEPMELNRIGFRLYEKFQPSLPPRTEGRRVKATLEIDKILDAD